MVELRDILFENVDRILELAPEQNQQRFVETAAKTIAMAYAGMNEGYPGFVSAIYDDGEPAGILLLGRSPVDKREPRVLQQYEYVYRLMGFFIDKHHQHKGIGKTALKLALEKLKEYPGADRLPSALECHKDNKAALSLYESLGFQNTGVLLSDDNYVLVRLPVF